MANADTSYQERSAHASRVGKAVEHLVAAGCILISDAKLNVSTSLVDDEGVDLVFSPKGRHRNSGRASEISKYRYVRSEETTFHRERTKSDVRST